LTNSLWPSQKDSYFSSSCTYEDWVWASLVFQTRSFGLLDGSVGSILVPYADMLDHQPGSQSGRLSADRSTFYLVANQDFEVGDEVTVSYGPRSNLQLLIQYGFIIEENPDDYVGITVDISAKETDSDEG
jgi:protein-histidine N-methyltransferase